MTSNTKDNEETDKREALEHKILDIFIALEDQPRTASAATRLASWAETLADFMANHTDLAVEEARIEATNIPEPTLQEVIDAGVFPTPEEYKKMIWVLRWYKDRLATLTQGKDKKEDV